MLSKYQSYIATMDVLISHMFKLTIFIMDNHFFVVHVFLFISGKPSASNRLMTKQCHVLDSY